MVTAQGDDARQGLSILRRANFLGIGRRFAGENAVVALFNLLDGVGIVVAVC